jgi:hypothetical protein
MGAVPTGVPSARTVALVLAVLGYRRRLRRRDRWSRSALLAHQDRALRRLREHAYQKSRFYQDFHAGLASAPLAALPVLTKQMLMESFDSVVTRPGLRLADVEDYLATLRGNELFQGRYFVSATAGTTGRRGVFLWNFPEWVLVVASYNRAFDWAGSTAGLTHRVKTAVVSSTNPSHQSARVGASIHSRWVPTLRAVVYDAGAVSRPAWISNDFARRRVGGSSPVSNGFGEPAISSRRASSSGRPRDSNGGAASSKGQVQILFSNSVMVSTSACWLSAMLLASVIASGFLPEVISAWAILIAPWWCLIIPSRKSRWPSALLASSSSCICCSVIMPSLLL